MSVRLRDSAFFMGAAFIAALMPLCAQAQSYPAKPIRLIVPFATGGLSDIIARMLAIRLTEAVKQPVIVDNRPGGSGVPGTEMAIRSAPDGHTLLMISAAYASSAALYKLPYDAINDVAAVALVGDSGFVAAVHSSVPVDTVKALIQYDQSNPGKLNYGSGGTGGANHLVTEYFNQLAGTRLTHVPYKGGGPALNDLVGGQIQVFFGTLSALTPQIKANRIRAIAVTTAKRSNALPHVPAIAETVAGYEAVTWSAVLGPKALPRDIIQRLNNEIERVLQHKDFRERLLTNGMEPVGGPPAKFRDILKRDVDKWARVIKAGNIRADD